MNTRTDHHKRLSLTAKSVWLSVSLCDFSFPNTRSTMISAMLRAGQEDSSMGDKGMGPPNLRLLASQTASQINIHLCKYSDLGVLL